LSRRAGSIVWFRQDLRLTDNPALSAAADQGSVLPVFIWSPDEETPFPPGGASKWWLHGSLAALSESLGGALVFRRGPTLECLRALVAETGARRVYWNRRYEPAGIARDRVVKAALREDGVEASSFNSALLFEPWLVRNKSGGPFKVFTPFYRHCLGLDPSDEPAPAPRGLDAVSGGGDSLASLGLEPRIDWAGGLRSTWRPGEAGAALQLERLLDGCVASYAGERDRPDRGGTSRLSPYLHFGEIGPRQIWHAVRTRYRQDIGEPFLRQLVWREFAHHLLYHFPRTPTNPLRAEFERFPWQSDPVLPRVWQRGHTGYPIVDAGMRELWVTGWMHNRVRMIVASFLVKHLRVNWQEGAYWFWDTLVDADLANNTLGWQWAAGCGADAEHAGIASPPGWSRSRPHVSVSSRGPCNRPPAGARGVSRITRVSGCERATIPTFPPDCRETAIPPEYNGAPSRRSGARSGA
jgi:deoxyribodipyrimidine photo-lyase